MIFDTDVLIWYFRGNQKAKEFISGVPYADRQVSSFCIMELAQDCRDRQEVRTVKEFIAIILPALSMPMIIFRKRRSRCSNCTRDRTG